MQRHIIAVFSDTHAGFTLGLMNPNTTLEEEDEDIIIPYTPRLSASQKHLWGLYQKHIEDVAKFANGDPITVIHNGDLTHGNRYMNQLVSTRLADQIVIAYYNFLPWFKLPNMENMRIVTGTGVHVFGEGSAEVVVARWLASEFKNIDIRCLNHSVLTINGISIDYAHHGPYPGSRNWLRGNVAAWDLKDMMITEIKRGKKPPDIYLRAHYHTWVLVFVNDAVDDIDYQSRLILTPSYSMVGEHTRKVTKSKYLVTNGLVAIEILDGEVGRIKRFTKTVDLRTKEILNDGQRRLSNGDQE